MKYSMGHICQFIHFFFRIKNKYIGDTKTHTLYLQKLFMLPSKRMKISSLEIFECVERISIFFKTPFIYME